MLGLLFVACDKGSGPDESSGMHYKHPTLVLYTNKAMTPDTVVTGITGIIGFTVSPLLLAGLEMDPNTGTISGTPMLVAAATDYTVIVLGSKGLDSCKIKVTVLQDTTGGGGGDTTHHVIVGKSLIRSTPYRVAGSLLIKTMTDTNYMCDGTLLQTEIFIHQDTARFRQQGNTLYLTYGPDDSLYTYDSINDTLGPLYAVLRYNRVYQRIGSGSGLQGTWNYTGESYDVVSGSLPAAEKADHGLQRQSAYRRDGIEV